MTSPRRLRAEAAGMRQAVNLRQQRLHAEVSHLGRNMHHALGGAGIVAVGLATGFLFHRLRPRWRGVRAGAGLGMSLLRLSPLARMLGERLSALIS